MPMMWLEITCMTWPKGRSRSTMPGLKANQYEVGDLVWMETNIGQLDITPKLRVPYEGPYMIRKWLGPLDYEVHMFCGSPKNCAP